MNQLKEHINIVAQQCPIGFYDKEVMLMTVFYRPKDFIEELKTIIGDFKDKYYQ
jgi:hypothetical protein